MVRKLTKNEKLYEDLVRDYRGADLEPADRAMLNYAEKLARSPGEMVPEDVQQLKDQGFSDSAISDIALQVSLFSVTNRMVDGLGGDVSSEIIEEASRLGMEIPDHMTSSKP